jgi:DNA-binding NtrC family response regulator
MRKHNAAVLVIDDEEVMRDILGTLLEREGYSVRMASSGQEGLDLAKSLPFDAVIVDVMMPGIDGLQVLDELKKHDEELPVLMITAYASMESAISAMKKGAFDYITKPFKNDEVLVVLQNAIERVRDSSTTLGVAATLTIGGQSDPHAVEPLEHERHAMVAVKLQLSQRQIADLLLRRPKFFRQRHGLILSAIPRLNRLRELSLQPGEIV